jgi:hypothetical protein
MKYFKYYLIGLLLFSLSCSEEEGFIEASKNENRVNKSDTIEICHFDKETGEYKTINVSDNALKAHLAHGDTQGNCDDIVTICKEGETIRVNKYELEDYEPFELGTCEAPGSEYTYVPDDIFELYLIDKDLDDEPDNLVLTSNIINVARLDLAGLGIFDLTGVEGFINLTRLDVQSNGLKKLDLSSNLYLKNLYCQFNNISQLDLSANVNLGLVYCYSNRISSENGMKGLKLPSGNKLVNLSCYRNKLTELDLSESYGLKYILCFDNNLNKLNVKNGFNQNVISFSSVNNPNLICIQVDDAVYSINNWTRVDDPLTFKEICN